MYFYYDLDLTATARILFFLFHIFNVAVKQWAQVHLFCLSDIKSRSTASALVSVYDPGYRHTDKLPKTDEKTSGFLSRIERQMQSDAQEPYVNDHRWARKTIPNI